MFTQPTPVLSLGSDLWSPSLSTQPEPIPAGGWADKHLGLVSAGWHLSSERESFHFALCTPVAVVSSVALKLPLCNPPSQPVKDFPSVWKHFLFHSSLPMVQVPSLFFCLCFFFFLLPYPGTWGVSCLLESQVSASVQYVFCRSCSTSRCISDVFVGRKVISTSYSFTILKAPRGF